MKSLGYGILGFIATKVFYALVLTFAEISGRANGEPVIFDKYTYRVGWIFSFLVALAVVLITWR